MPKFRVRPIDVVYWAALAALDLFIYMALGMSLMGYDDNYDSSKGEYGSLASMNTIEKIFYFCFILWNVFNVCLLVYVARVVCRKFKPRLTNQ